MSSSVIGYDNSIIHTHAAISQTGTPFPFNKCAIMMDVKSPPAFSYAYQVIYSSMSLSILCYDYHLFPVVCIYGLPFMFCEYDVEVSITPSGGIVLVFSVVLFLYYDNCNRFMEIRLAPQKRHL